MIIFRSLRNQLSVISVFFLIFITLVMLQFYYTQSIQFAESRQLKLYHRVISDYIEIDAMEKRLAQKIQSYADGTRQMKPERDIPQLLKQRDDWFKAFQLWHAGLLKVQEKIHSESSDLIFTKSFLENKIRQGENYLKIIQLCRESKKKEALMLLNIEQEFHVSKEDITTVILREIDEKMQADSSMTRRFYMGTALALLAALLFLVLVSVGIFRNISINVHHLEESARRIARGDFSKIVGVNSPEEFVSLAQAFNEMQSAVKLRDDKISEDNEEIRKLNELLEQKVFERNKTITLQNKALTRKNQELEQVLYAASHDLRTPLIGIQGFSEELKQISDELLAKIQAKDTEPAEIENIVKEDLIFAVNHIQNGSRRMGILLEGLLRISRMGRESLQIQKVDMNELVKNVAAGFDFQLNELGGAFHISSLAPCYADASQLEQVFTNLISNAIKYRDKSRPLQISIGSKLNAESVQYFVQDNGIGIKKEDQAKVFHAFFRVDNEATEGEGIGLTIVTRSLDLHNGSISLESTEGKGSTFLVELPATPVQQPTQGRK